MMILKKLNEYHGTTNDLDRPLDKKFKCSESQHQEINRKIEKYVNKTKLFPDFWDIKKLIGRVNQEKGLNLSDIQVNMVHDKRDI